MKRKRNDQNENENPQKKVKPEIIREYSELPYQVILLILRKFHIVRPKIVRGRDIAVLGTDGIRECIDLSLFDSFGRFKFDITRKRFQIFYNFFPLMNDMTGLFPDLDMFKFQGKFIENYPKDRLMIYIGNLFQLIREDFVYTKFLFVKFENCNTIERFRELYIRFRQPIDIKFLMKKILSKKYKIVVLDKIVTIREKDLDFLIENNYIKERDIIRSKDRPGFKKLKSKGMVCENPVAHLKKNVTINVY